MQSKRFGTFRALGLSLLAAVATFAATASAQAATTLSIGVPSAEAANSPGHPYRAGLERAIANKACAFLKGVRCTIKELPTFPGPANDDQLKAAKVDAYMNAATLTSGAKAESAGLLEAIDVLAENGDLGKLRRQYLDANRPWGIPLSVGVDKKYEAEIKRLCAAIKAECTLVRNNNANALFKLLDDKKVAWIAGSQGWKFQDKALEDRVSMEREGAEDDSGH